MSSVLTKGENLDTNLHSENVTIKPEIRVMQLHIKEHQSYPAGTDSFSSPSEGSNPADTLIVDF